MSKRKNPDESANPNKDFCEFLMGELSNEIIIHIHAVCKVPSLGLINVETKKWTT